MITSNDDIIGIDYGEKRIGIARINPQAGFMEPLGIVDATAPDMLQQLIAFAKQYGAQAFVVGRPRGLDGQTTAQTVVCETFAAELQSTAVPLPVYLVDEAGTSKAAKELQRDGQYLHSPIDAIAAGLLLVDFLSMSDEHRTRV